MTFYDNKEQITCVNCGSRLNFAGSSVVQCCSKTYKLDMHKKGFKLAQYTGSEWAAFQAGIKDEDLTVESLAPEKQEIVDNETLSILQEINDKDVVQPSGKVIDIDVPTPELDSHQEDLMKEQKTDDDIKQEESVQIEEVISDDQQLVVDGTESLLIE